MQAGMGREGAAVGEVQGVPRAFGEAELPGHVTPSALTSQPGHRAFPLGHGERGRGRTLSITRRPGRRHPHRDSAGERRDEAHRSLRRPNSTPAPLCAQHLAKGAAETRPVPRGACATHPGALSLLPRCLTRGTSMQQGYPSVQQTYGAELLPLTL